MSILKKDELLNKALRTAKIDVPELGGEVVVQELTVEQRVKIYQATKDGNTTDPLKFTIATVVEGMIDPKLEPKDFDKMKQVSGAGLERIAGKILELSGITSAAEIKNVSTATR